MTVVLNFVSNDIKSVDARVLTSLQSVVLYYNYSTMQTSLRPFYIRNLVLKHIIGFLNLGSTLMVIVPARFLVWSNETFAKL